jgi:hypothetical protein
MHAETQNPQNETEVRPIQKLVSWGEWWEHFEDLAEPAEDDTFLRAA